MKIRTTFRGPKKGFLYIGANIDFSQRRALIHKMEFN
jgi:hypothetical protein